jgi:hypothetical protein
VVVLEAAATKAGSPRTQDAGIDSTSKVDPAESGPQDPTSFDPVVFPGGFT